MEVNAKKHAKFTPNLNSTLQKQPKYTNTIIGNF